MERTRWSRLAIHLLQPVRRSLLTIGLTMSSPGWAAVDVLRIEGVDGSLQGSAFALGSHGPILTARHVVESLIPDCSSLDPPSGATPKGAVAVARLDSISISCYDQLDLNTANIASRLVGPQPWDAVSLRVYPAELAALRLTGPSRVAVVSEVFGDKWTAVGWKASAQAYVQAALAVTVSSCVPLKGAAISLCSDAAGVGGGMSGGPFMQVDNSVVGGVSVFLLTNGEARSDLDIAFNELREHLSPEEYARIAGGQTYGLAALSVGPHHVRAFMRANPAAAKGYSGLFVKAVRKIYSGAGTTCGDLGNNILWGGDPVRLDSSLGIYLLAGELAMLGDEELARQFLLCREVWIAGVGTNDQFAWDALRMVRPSVCARWPDLSVAACQGSAASASINEVISTLDERSRIGRNGLDGSRAQSLLAVAASNAELVLERNPRIFQQANNANWQRTFVRSLALLQRYERLTFDSALLQARVSEVLPPDVQALKSPLLIGSSKLGDASTIIQVARAGAESALAEGNRELAGARYAFGAAASARTDPSAASELIGDCKYTLSFTSTSRNRCVDSEWVMAEVGVAGDAPSEAAVKTLSSVRESLDEGLKHLGVVRFLH